MPRRSAETPETPVDETAETTVETDFAEPVEDETAETDAPETDELDELDEPEDELSHLRYVPGNGYGRYVHRKLPHAARGDVADQIIEAADRLGYPRAALGSTSDGFKVPENIDRYLFPSDYSDDVSDEE
jgi:hypothetical protein